MVQLQLQLFLIVISADKSELPQHSFHSCQNVAIMG